MKRTSVIVAAALVALTIACSLGAATAERATSRHPAANDTYTITSRLQLVQPFTVEITYYPLHRPSVGENPNWRKDYAGMTEFLRATPAENWDETMRRDLLAELRTAGIEPDRLTDKQVVEQVSRWAMKRSRSSKDFAIWTVYYPD